MSNTLHIGFDFYIMVSEIESILPTTSQKMMKNIYELNENGEMLIYDCTKNKSRKSFIMTKGNNCYISAISTGILTKRLERQKSKGDFNEE